jgi:hydroxymethylbilane synthase
MKRSRALRVGTRGSTLALVQSQIVARLLDDAGWSVEMVTIVTAGDARRPDTAWGEGAFVTAIEDALRAGEVDLAVHSAKDVPIEPETDLAVGAYPVRADARDALVRRERTGGQARGGPRDLADLPAGAVIGTDSPRRTGFLLALRPDLRVVPLHGNVDTRLRRLDEGEVDALVLAVAGLERLGRGDRISAVLAPEIVPPAPGQGALAVQVRADDRRVLDAVRALDVAEVRAAVSVERAVLDGFGGGCRAPLGALASVAHGGAIEVVAGSVEPDGRNRVIQCRLLRGSAKAEARELGRALRSREVVSA